MGSGILATIALAGIFWAFEVTRAKLTHQPPPWKVPREREPTPPLARAMSGSDISLPRRVDAKERRRGLLVVAVMYAGMAAVGTAAALITRAYGGSGGAMIAAAVGAVVGAMVVALVVAVVRLVIKARQDGHRA